MQVQNKNQYHNISYKFNSALPRNSARLIRSSLENSLNSLSQRNQNIKTQTIIQVHKKQMISRKKNQSQKRQLTTQLGSKKGAFSHHINLGKTQQFQKSNEGQRKQSKSKQKLQPRMKKVKQEQKANANTKKTHQIKPILHNQFAKNRIQEKPKPKNKKKLKTNQDQYNHHIKAEQKLSVQIEQSETLQRCSILMKQINQLIRDNTFIENKDKSLSLVQRFKEAQNSNQKINLFSQFLQNLTKNLSDIFKSFQQKLNLSSRKIEPIIQQQRHKARQQQQPINLFSCNILNQEQDYKQFLVKSISSKFGDIRKTNFLYHQDNLNPHNIHRYINGKRNIAIVIQTVDNYFVSLFAQPSFQKRPQKGKGLIISLSNRKVYENLPDKNPIIYDQSYVIFGNSDVRIGDKDIHSTFGCPTTYYNCKGDKANVLFGSQNRKNFQIKHLEIFQVIF